MSGLSIHHVKKIDICQDFIGEGKSDEFAIIKINVECENDPYIKEFGISLFIKNDMEMNITNLLLARNHGRENPKPKKSDPEDPNEPIDPFEDE